MINAQDELLLAIQQAGKTSLDVQAIIVGISKDYVISENDLITNPNRFECIFRLPKKWTSDEWLTFLKQLNFNYAGDEYGEQELYGYVWFKDGSWLERYEYDGREEWHFKHTPDLEQFFMGFRND